MPSDIAVALDASAAAETSGDGYSVDRIERIDFDEDSLSPWEIDSDKMPIAKWDKLTRTAFRIGDAA